MLKNYTKTNAKKLSKWKIGNISEPINIKIYWLNSLTLHGNSNHINHNIHHHSFYEAHFNIAGFSDYVDEEGRFFNLFTEQGIMFSPQSKHSIKDMSHNAIRFSLAFALEQGSVLDNLLMKNNIYCFSLSPKLIDCLDVILYEVSHTSFLSPVLIRNRVLEIICEIFRALGIDEPLTTYDDNTFENVVLLKATKYISDNQDKLLTCSEIAEYCHYNVQYLSRVFVKQTGRTLLEYIHEQKIRRAEILLADETLSLRQISEMLGFANEYYFNSFFKRINGMSPGLFRKLKKK